MPKTSEITASVIRKIRPSKEDREKMSRFSDALIKTAEKLGKPFYVKPMSCGSVEKNTWISSKSEVDLFLLFSPLESRKKLEETGLMIAANTIKEMNGTFERRYAEHPYLSGTINFEGTDYLVDIVPCYDIKDLKKIKSAVDRTPHHVRYVKKNLQLPDEVRLLKQFCKANRVYGADVRVNGFSGYLCELMIINYGKFELCLKEAAKWRAPTALSMNNFSKEKLIKKYKSPMVFIDPVDSERNVAAAVSPESFYRFVEASKNFLDKPSEKFFFPVELTPYTMGEINNEIRKRGTRWYMIKFEKPDVVDDTLYPQVKRCMNAIETILTSSGFRVLRKDFWIGSECAMLFEMDVWMTPAISKNIGPNIYTKHAEDFLKHYKERKIFIEGENWVVELENEFTTVLHLLKNLVSFNENKLKEKGIPSKIAPSLAKSVVVSGADFSNSIEKMPKEFRVFMREWFEKDIDII